MYEFKSEGRFEIKGRGIAFVTVNPHDCDEFHHLYGQDVLIDGVRHKVLAVERFAHCPPWEKGESISLLVPFYDNCV